MILVLDFGSQYTQLIARRVREQHVYCEIHPFNLSLARVRALAPEGIILSGGPASVYAEGAPLPDPAILDLGVPVLGVCYGMGGLAMQAGGGGARPRPAASSGTRASPSSMRATSSPASTSVRTGSRCG